MAEKIEQMASTNPTGFKNFLDQHSDLTEQEK
jgi:hypothetical protein